MLVQVPAGASSVVVFAVLYFRYLDAKAEGRLSEGIDPPWMRDVEAARGSRITPA